jgi:HAD superfamily hydrolase (TIGR01450 family)
MHNDTICGIPTRAMRLYDGYIFDLDGTTYLGDALLPTVASTLERLRTNGRRTVFLSNNPTHTRMAYVARLRGLGIPVTEADVIHSSLVMVNFLLRRMPRASLFVVGEEPLKEELRAAGFNLTESAADTDAVIASFDRTFAYWKLQVAFDAIRRGAHFYATNGDRYCPVPGGGQPDAASVIAAIEACTSTKCEAIVGKPSAYTVEAILDLLQLPADRCLMTGDRLETDVAMALNAGMAGALVLTGATDEAMLCASDIQPTYALRQLSDLLP